MMLVLLSRLANAGCDSTVTATSLAETLNEANLAYAAMDEDGFLTYAKRAEEEIACLGAVLTPAQVAAWDRVDGLRHFLEGDTSAATASFRAARALDPKYTFSERIAPAGGKLAQLYAGAEPVISPDTEAIAVRSGLKVWVDGSASTERPTEEPAVVQVGASDTKLDLSLVVRPGDTLSLPSSLLAATAVAAAEETEEEAPTKSPKPRSSGGNATPFWIATGASALVAGGLFAASAFTNAEFAVQPSEALLTTNHVTYYSSLGMAGVTVALAGVSLVVTL